jgi:hypothetical protein
MSLTGPFYNAVNEDENIYDVNNIHIPGETALGTIPAEYIFEELKCIVTIPCPPGTTFKLINQDDEIIVPAGKIIVERAVASTVNINRHITAQTTLRGIFESKTISSGCRIIFIKKITRIP